MASIINASSSGSGGIVQTADASGILQLQSNGTTAAYVDTSANLNVSNSLNTPNTFGFKNRIINGAMVIDQRNAGASVTPTTSGYTPIINETTGGATSYVSLRNTGGQAYIGSNNNALVLAVTSNATEAMRIDSSGNLLVGTTTGNFNARITSYNASSYTLESIRTGTGSEGHAVFVNANGAVGSIFTNASLTIYNTTSDYRLKTVVGAINDSGTRIDSLEPIEYTWNSNGQRARGFLAHKFQEVYASSVTGTKDAVDADGNPIHQGMQAGSTEVIADLVAEIQSLRKRLTALESKG